MKKILLVFTIIFFAAMLFLTIFADQIHNSFLPKVTVSRPKQKSFPFEYTDQDGNTQTGSAQKNALPESMLGQDIYVIYTAEKNGTVRSFVRCVAVETGQMANGYAEVISGVDFDDKIVIESSGELTDGGEVLVEKG